MELQNHVYDFKNLSQYSSVVHGVSTKAFGSMKRLDDKQIDQEALLNFEKTLDITDTAVTMKQIHSGNVSVIENTKALRILQTDGLVTNKKHLPLAVLTADCLPILFYDPKKGVIGVAHAGYKGLLNHIIEHTIQKFVLAFESNPKDIIVGVGPSIQRDCYEVGVELVEKFQEEFPSFDDIFAEKTFAPSTSSGSKSIKYFLDLRGVAQQCLLKVGILEEHIEAMNICTKDDPNFYSYRRGDGDKRFVSMISLV